MHCSTGYSIIASRCASTGRRCGCPTLRLMAHPRGNGVRKQRRKKSHTPPRATERSLTGVDPREAFLPVKAGPGHRLQIQGRTRCVGYQRHHAITSGLDHWTMAALTGLSSPSQNPSNRPAARLRYTVPPDCVWTAGGFRHRRRTCGQLGHGSKTRRTQPAHTNPPPAHTPPGSFQWRTRGKNQQQD